MAKSSEPIRQYDDITDTHTRTIAEAKRDRTVPLALPAFVSPSWNFKEFIESEEKICKEIAAQHGQGAAGDGE
jgi:hypothetical protein